MYGYVGVLMAQRLGDSRKAIRNLSFLPPFCLFIPHRWDAVFKAREASFLVREWYPNFLVALF